MSFTEDELQAFNSILEQRFAAHRQEIEQTIEQRLDLFQQKIAHQLKEGMTNSLEQWSTSTREQSETTIQEKLNERQDQLVHLLSQEAEQKARQVEATIDRMLAAQLLGIEQLLSQHTAKLQSAEVTPANLRLPSETQEELIAALNQALERRLTSLSETLQHSTKTLERQLTTRLHSLRDELAYQRSKPLSSSSEASLQEVLAGVEHLEHIMESMQVAMTANHALLSNRLYHHQQLPLERAHPHPGGQTHIAQVNGVGSLLTQAKERLASGQEPAIPTGPDESEAARHERSL